MFGVFQPLVHVSIGTGSRPVNFAPPELPLASALSTHQHLLRHARARHTTYRLAVHDRVAGGRHRSVRDAHHELGRVVSALCSHTRRRGGQGGTARACA